jgi:hypothetical protein
VISGDHERTALDFQKHYRLHIVHLMDTDVSFQFVHNRSGWPFLMLVDPNGNVVHKANNLIDRETKILESLARMKASPEAAPIRVVDGIRYSAQTLRRSGEWEKPQVREYSSRLAAAPDGRVFLVFTASRENDSSVWLRVWNGQTWSEDRPLAASPADEYDGSVLATGLEHICSPSFATGPQGQTVLVWCQKKRGGAWELQRSDGDARGQWSKPQALVTVGNPRYCSAVYDAHGKLWISYAVDTDKGRQIQVQQL